MSFGKNSSMISVTGDEREVVEKCACFVNPGVNTSPKRFVASPPNLSRASMEIVLTQSPNVEGI